MRIILLLSSIFFGQMIFGQRIPSSCKANDSIVSKYKDDADRLTLQRIQRNNLDYKYGTTIPKYFSDTILKALLAVYNSTSLSARDTVINIFKIHTFKRPLMNQIILKADTNLSWMQNLKNGIIPTGYENIDIILEAYYLKLDRYYRSGNTFWLTLKTDSNYNLEALAKNIETIYGVKSCYPDGIPGDGDDLWDSIYTDHVELIYSIGWGDCPSGCIERRYWKFKVYFDCSVEFDGSYGSRLGIKHNNLGAISVSPNPFKESISINGNANKFTYSISDLIGQELIKDNSKENNIGDLGWLNSGIYLLKIESENKIFTIRIMKE